MSGGEPQQFSPISPLWALFAFLGSIIGAAFMAFLSTGGVVAEKISYVDLAAVLLGAVTVILTVFALAIAIAAIYGYREFMNRTAAKAALTAKEVAEPTAIAEVREYLDRNLDPDIRDRARTILTQLLTPEVIRELAIEQTNRIDGAEARDQRMDAAQAASHSEAIAAAAAEAQHQEERLSAMDTAEINQADYHDNDENGQRGDCDGH